MPAGRDPLAPPTEEWGGVGYDARHFDGPTAVAFGADGAIYVVDMYRFLIEHPRWIAPERLKQIDVRAGAQFEGAAVLRLGRRRRRGAGLQRRRTAAPRRRFGARQ